MNANARDFDPHRVSSGGYQPPNTDVRESGYYSQATTESALYYDPAGYQEYADPSGQYYASYPTQAAEFLDPTPNWNETAIEEVPGCYYPIANLSPQLYGAPISALAYDDEYEAIYVASHTQALGRRRGNRASMMVTHSTLDGMLYSSCAAHPEADSATMNSLYQVMYGVGGTSSANRRPAHIPAHAYQPPYGMDDTGTFGTCHMGITTLLPTKGYVASVSPSAVRFHSHGGLCMSDHDITGMASGTMHPGSMHISVGGTALGSHKSHVHCMDFYQGLRIVSSNTFRSETMAQVPFGVICMATNHEKQTIVAGCSDGTLRLLDASWRARGGSELAKIKSHAAGVNNVAVSSDGNLVATTGFAARSSASLAPYAFPDQHLFIYDVRFLGRGGILHPFSAVRGGPRLVSFLPDISDQPHNRLLVASGQAQGGIQIIIPFEIEQENPFNFLMPQLAHQEIMTAMHVSEQYLAIGTSQSNVLQYKMTGHNKLTTTHSYNTTVGEFIPSGGYGGTVPSRVTTALPKEKQALLLPSYMPELPPLSLDPSLLQTADPGVRNGGTDKLKSIFTSYILCKDPATLNDEESSAFGAFANDVILTSPKHTISSQVMEATSKEEGDVLSNALTSKLEIDLLENTTTDKQKARKELALPNPNRLLYSEKLFEVCYETAESRGEWRGRDHREDTKRRNWRDRAESDDTEGVPKRYRRTLRPSNQGGGFSHAQFNETGLFPGWDYPPSMPNAYAPPVLLALYFVPEIKSLMLSRQFDTRLYSSSSGKVPPLSTELGFLFHQIECLSQYARIYPGESTNSKVGAFVPTNFLTSFAAMPEAEALALLDGAPAAVEKARRPEAFLRFLLHHLNKEVSISTKKAGSKIIDDLHGFNFVSINEFISGSGPPSTSKHRALTIDLSYEPFVKSSSKVKFGEVLRNSLSKESPLRAWCQETRSYETVVQRKIATSLPTVLALSCCCAGKRNEEGLSIWRNDFPENGHWLPEMVEIEIDNKGDVIVRESTEEARSSDRIWMEFKGSSQLPSSIADIVTSSLGSIRKHRYRLDAVLSFVRDDMDAATIEQLSLSPSEEANGHHVLHARISSGCKRRALDNQRSQANRVASTMESASKDMTTDVPLTVTSGTKPEVFRKRIEDVDQRLKSLDDSSDDWILFNGFVVSSTIAEDARAFDMAFKEPCLVVFRAVDDTPKSKKENRKDEAEFIKIPTTVMRTRSISTGRAPDYSTNNDLPGEGDLIAFDAEFVSVQEEESILTNTGSKLVTRETRYALARVSVIDCRSGNIILDDHVLPCEPVVDYLTRFSGIVEGDLDPKNSPHHLISMRSAYLKLRCLTERGCIFVGHGLTQDFLTVNLVVPLNQIIDTVEIYHQDRMRWISLRFLTNYVFGRDMQQDVHDSIEDARAAYDLYLKALEWKQQGTLGKFIQEMYVYGAARDWKLGIDDAFKK